MRSEHWILTVLLVSFSSFKAKGNDFKGFDDNNLFSLNWPGLETLLVSVI